MRTWQKASKIAAVATVAGGLALTMASPAGAHNVRINHSGAVFDIFNNHSQLRGCREAGWQQEDWAEVVYRNGYRKVYHAAPNGGSCLLYDLDTVGPVRWRACSDPGYVCTTWRTV